jgi:threonine/homoserine/homoserine lactone efflux protein
MPAETMLLAFLVATFVTVAIPGPSVLFLMARSIEGGRPAGIYSMLGLETGALIHVGAAAAGLTAVVAASPPALAVLRYAGAAYLLFLGVRQLRARVRDSGEAVPVGTRRHFRDGVLVDLLNPKTGLFFVAFLPQFIDPASGPAALQVGLLGLCFVLLAVLFDGGYVLLAGRLGGLIHGSPRGRQHLDRVTGGVYVALAGAAAFV